jgi:hypothetical protein
LEPKKSEAVDEKTQVQIHRTGDEVRRRKGNLPDAEILDLGNFGRAGTNVMVSTYFCDFGPFFRK